MDFLAHSAVRYVIAGVIVVFFIAMLRRGYTWVSSRDDRELEAQLRDAIARGDLRRAGDIQVQRGNLIEATRVYLRGGEHARAAAVFVKLGDEKKAADEYEAAEDWARAGPLFRKLGDLARAAVCFEKSDVRSDRLAAAECFSATGEHLKAGRIYQDLEDYEKAADCFAKVEDLVSLDVALTMLENAALAKTTDPARKKELWRRAAEVAVKAGAHDRAARAFDEAGELRKAAGIFEKALKKYDVAAALMIEAGDTAEAERLTGAAGGQATVNETRLSRARARGDKALIAQLEKETRQLETALAETKVGREGRASSKDTVRGDGDATVVPKGARVPAGPRFEDRFELLGELGRGGMGVVFRAKDQKLQRFVAMKFLPEDVEVGSTLHRLFLREARAAAALSHPGIVTVYDVGELDGREFIAMELVDGKTLDRVLDEDGPLPLPEALEVMEKVLLAMEYAHTKSVIHRDLKPANLMRTRDGVKVMDFGLAKVVSGRSSSGQTLIAGTPSYMPPEQKTGHADHRSDIFALGATFYELMSGVLPGNPGEPPSATSDYPTLRQRVPGSPARLSDLVMRCLDHDRNHRPQDIVSVLRELREIRAEVARAPVEPQPRRRAEHPAAASPKLVDDVKKLRAPAPRISREEDDDAPHVERVERVEKVAASPVKPRPAGARPIIPREEDDGVAPGARRGKPR